MQFSQQFCLRLWLTFQEQEKSYLVKAVGEW